MARVRATRVSRNRTTIARITLFLGVLCAYPHTNVAALSFNLGRKTMIRTIAMLLMALVIAYGGVALSRYAEADDAPGGVVMGWLLVVVAVALGARAFLRWNRARTSPDNT
jgi:hypothetical protein